MFDFLIRLFQINASYLVKATDSGQVNIHIYIKHEDKEITVFQLTDKIFSSLFSSNDLPNDVTDHFCHPNTQMQKLETVKEKWYFSCIMCAHSSWSLIFNCYISEVNCILPTQFQLPFALFPPCPHPLMLHYCTWLSRLPHSNGFHAPAPLLSHSWRSQSNSEIPWGTSQINGTMEM